MSLSTPNPKVQKSAIGRQNVGAASAPGQSNVTSTFLYRTVDTRAQVEAAGYFNDIVGRLTMGSIIDAVMNVGGTPVLETYLVTSVTPGSDVVVKRESSTAANLTDNTTGTPGNTLALPATKQRIIVPFQLADLANAGVFKITPGFRFKALSAGLRVAKPATTAAKLATLTPQISGVAMTGGVISATSANATPAGNLVAGTAITALNTGLATDTLEVAASSVTAFVEGDGWVEFEVVNLDLADALASLNAA